MDEHWIPVQDCCQPCAVTYDWILHFESLEEEAQMFLQLMNEADHGHLRWSNHYLTNTIIVGLCVFLSVCLFVAFFWNFGKFRSNGSPVTKEMEWGNIG